MLADFAEQVKASFDVAKDSVDELVKYEGDDGKIDGNEALKATMNAVVKLIPIWISVITSLVARRE